MKRFFDSELETFRSHLMIMGETAIRQVRDALKALVDADVALADRVIAADDELDNLEMSIDDEAIRYMNLRAPVATELRLVIVGMTRESLWGIPLDPSSSTPDRIFFVCGAFIGAAGGALQAASRTMMARHTTPDSATEAFGLFALSGKVASFMSPALIALATTATGSQRLGIAPLVVLFLIGLFLLSFVKPKGEMVS